MASPTVSPPEPSRASQADATSTAIDRRIRQTRWQLKLNDFATGLIALVGGVLGFLMLAALGDHWLVAGGLGFWSRLVLFLMLVGGGGWYCLRVLFPPLVYQVNPIYAAQTLEQARPSLKNGLINLLLLRRDAKVVPESQLSRRVVESLQTRTADELDQIPQEVAVDRIQLIRRGYALVGIFALVAVYFMLSPKSPWPSFGRVLWPWAPIAAPSRVEVERIQPGDATVYQGRSAMVSAAVDGLLVGEDALVYYSSEDGQIVDQAVPMTPGETPGRLECPLPPGNAGLQQSLTYWIVAGDCRTREFELEMEVPPTVVVDSLRYVYPRYTRLAERLVSDTADVRAIEGTRIVVEATANREIQWANLELSGQTKRPFHMRSEGSHARGEFTLKLGQDDAEVQRWYQIRFAESESGENRENIEPVRHRIEVFADRDPTVRMVDPPAENATIPLDGMAEMKVEAEDPDFALSRVAVLAERNGSRLAIPLLLDRTDTPRGFEGKFQSTYRFQPAELGLQVGDEVRYRAVAEDNRQPERNRTETDWRWLKIGPPGRADRGGESSESGASDESQGSQPSEQRNEPGGEGEAENPESESEQRESGDEASEGASGEEQEPGEGEGESGETSDEPGEGQKGDEGAKAEQNGEGESGKREEPIDGEGNAGDVFEEVMKQMEEEKQEAGGKEGESGSEAGEQSDSEQGEQKEPGEGDPSGKPQAGEQSDDAQEQPGESGVPPNRTESGGGEESESTPESEQGPEGMGGEPSGASPNEPDGQSPKTESDAGGGTPTGESGKGKPSEDNETIDGGEATPEDLENADPESVERKPGTPGDGTEPEHSESPGPGSPEAGDSQVKPGEQPTDSRPTPKPMEANQPNAKKPSSKQPADQQSPPEEQAPSIDKKQSDSDPGESTDGDRSGDGSEGGGADSDREGLGNPGSTTPDDQGGSPGGEQGEGETGPDAGEQVPTDQQTGNQAKMPNGSGEGDGSPQGPKPGQSPRGDSQPPPSGQNPPGEPTDGTPGADPRNQGTSDPKEDAPTAPTGGNTEGTNAGEGMSADSPGGEEAIKEYSDKATDLALEYLEDQLDQAEPNRELLDRLGWTRNDLERFVRRWRQMKADAKQSGEAGDEARQELDDALESLGLRPGGTAIQGGQTATDRIGQTESIRTTAPPAWREAAQEYTKSVGAGVE